MTPLSTGANEAIIDPAHRAVPSQPAESRRLDSPILIIRSRKTKALLWGGVGVLRVPAGHALEAAVDVGREHRIDPFGKLVLSGLDGVGGFSPGGLLLAARSGMFGLRVIDHYPVID